MPKRDHKIIWYFTSLLKRLLVQIKSFSWKSKGLSEEIFKTTVTSGIRFAPKLTFIYNGIIVAKFKGNCLIQYNKSFTHRNVINLFIIYGLDTWSRDLNTDMLLDLTRVHNFHCQR